MSMVTELDSTSMGLFGRIVKKCSVLVETRRIANRWPLRRTQSFGSAWNVRSLVPFRTSAAPRVMSRVLPLGAMS